MGIRNLPNIFKRGGGGSEGELEQIFDALPLKRVGGEPGEFVEVVVLGQVGVSGHS